MSKSKVITFLICFLSGLFIGGTAWAEELEVPEEELARETVLPRFERGEAVKSRNIITNKKFELGGYLGWNFTEPIYSQGKFGFMGGYHFDEQNVLMINFAKWMDGRNTQYTDLLRQQVSLEFNRAPNLEWSLWGNYELQAYYGKVSLTKQGVMNLHLYPILGFGVTKYVHKTYPGINFGIGQKYYLSKSFAIRFDFKLQYQQGPSPFLGGGKLLVTLPPGTTAPVPADFKDKFSLGTIFDLGFSILL